MKIQKVFFTILGVFGFSLGGGLTASYPAQADVLQCNVVSNELSEEECCQLALEKNTIEALEEFLRLYPPGRSNSACSALAATALLTFGPDEPGTTNDPPNDPGYGT